MTTRVAYFPALLSASVPDSTLALAPAGVPPESLQSFASCDRDVPTSCRQNKGATDVLAAPKPPKEEEEVLCKSNHNFQ